MRQKNRDLSIFNFKFLKGALVLLTYPNMKKLINKIFAFILPFVLLLASSIFLPPTPRVSKSYIFGKIGKDSLLKKVPKPRLVFIGGSNLSFGINSKMLRDSLKINPINTGIAGNIGLLFMLESTLQYIQPGDIVIVSPEYEQFFGRYAYGSEELLRTILDVSPKDWRKLNIDQCINILPYFVKFAVSKIMPGEYIDIKEDPLYGVNSFNEFGDVNKHWKMEKPTLPFSTGISGHLNYKVIVELQKFKDEVEQKKATLFIGFPGIQLASYNNSKDQITEVASELKEKGFPLLGTPERYVMPESLVFDTAYHLTEDGMEYRTRLIIEDLEPYVYSLSSHGI